MMSYKECMAFALKHYNEGGDGMYECFDEKQYAEAVAEGRVFTEEELLGEFHRFDEYRREIEATAW